MDTLSDSGCADFYSGSDSESEDSFYEIESVENECYDPSFQNGPSNISDKHEDYENSENGPSNLSDKHEDYENSENGPSNLSDKHEDYENSETHSVGETEGENDAEKRNGPDKQEGYENSETHSVDETEGENEVVKRNGPDKPEFYENSETHSVGESEGENEVEKRNGPDKPEFYENSETHSFGESEGENEVEKRNGPDKPEFYENSETHSFGENEGEPEIENLKRKLENEQKRLFLLNKELEEERNASAVAADEAMAMITRLQEEKAALHMEASQYLRMMDEQAEYDMEALNKANDLVSEKDKEIQDLEAELEYFRNRYENELFNGNYKSFKNSKKSVLGLDDEKKYILRSLTEFKMKFHQNDKDSLDKNGGKSVENEILNLNERLEALESERDLIEHLGNMVEIHGGVQFVQEIAQHLRDLRRVRFD